MKNSLITSTIRSHFFLIATLLLITRISVAQVYPVTGSLMWSPPYTPVLGELSLPSASNNFRLSLILNDINTPTATVKLRFKLEGSGIRLQTEQNYTGLPITLTNGVPELFYGADLQEYLRATSLQFQGMSRESFMRNAGVPDGFYRVSFQAISLDRNLPLSDEISTNVFISSNEIPMLISPTCGEKLRINDPQYIMFSWLNRATNFSSTEYEFELFWVQPKGRPAGDVVLSSIPIYTSTITSPALIYTSAEPALIAGEEYVWRVKARDQSGLSVYKQQGYSQPCKFQWGDPCAPPENVKVEVQGSQKVTVSWYESPAVIRYTLEYRPKDSDNPQWYPIQTTNTSYILSNQLRPSTSYEFRVKNTCGINSSDYSPIDSFRTQDLFQNRTLSCGERSGIPLPDSTNKLQTLRAGDQIQMGGFTMTIISAMGSNGRFSGKLHVPVKLLNSSLEGNFSNLGINNEYKVYSGVVNITSGSVALLPPDVQNRVNGYLETVNVIINRTEGGLNNATAILNNGNQVLNEIENLAETVTGIDSTLSREIENIRNEVNTAMEAIGRGDSTEGTNIFNNAMSWLNEVLGGGNGNSLSDKLKALVQRLTLERKTKDSTERVSVIREILENETSVREAQESIAKDIDDIDLGGERQNDIAQTSYAMFDDGDEQSDIVSEEQLGKIKTQQSKYRIYTDGIERLAVKTNRLKYLEKGIEVAVGLLMNDALKSMVDNIKADSQKMGADFLKDIMDGNISKSVEDYVSEYLSGVIEYRIQEAISQ